MTIETAGRCAGCAHWKFTTPDWEFDELMIGECKAVKMRCGIEEDVETETGIERFEDGWGEAMKKALVDAKAIAVDGSGYYAALRTFGDFGCVLFSPAKPQP